MDHLALSWADYYFPASLLVTGTYVSFFLVYLGRFSFNNPRTGAFQRLLIGALWWALFDMFIHFVGHHRSPQTTLNAYRFLSFLFLLFPPAASELILSLITQVTRIKRLLIYAPFGLLYLAGLIWPASISTASFDVHPLADGPYYWNLAFKALTLAMSCLMLAALARHAAREENRRAQKEELLLLAGGVSTLAVIIGAQILKLHYGARIPWMANAGAGFTALAAFWGMARYGQVFSPNYLYAATLQVIPGGLAHLHQGRILWANQALARLVGRENSEQLEGGRLADILAAEPQAPDKDDLVGRLSRGELEAAEITLVAQDQSQVPCLASSAPLHPHDHTLGSVAVFQDLTTRKKAEMESLLREKLAGAIETAGAVCHEMNQPLQSLLTRLELLQLKLSGNQYTGQDLKIMLENLERITGITSRLLKITAYETTDYVGKTRILDLHKSSAKLDS